MKDYYFSQINDIIEQVKEEEPRYQFNQLLEKVFVSKIEETSNIEFSKQENKMLENVEYSVNKKDEMGKGDIQYKIKNPNELEKNFELNPQKASFEYSKLMERPQILNDSTIVMLLIKYEEAISGVFKYLINKYPSAYLNDKTITYAELMTKNSNIDDIKELFLEKEIEEIMRRPLSDWYKLFEKHKVQFDLESEEFIKFKEVYFARNIVVHNQSLVNDTYLANIKSDSDDVKKGDRLDIDKEYLTEAFKTTEIIIYDTFWALRKVSGDPKELRDSLYNIAFEHMLNEEWQISEHIFKLLLKEEKQSEADKNWNTINYWISVKNQERINEIQSEIQAFDISALGKEFKIAKYALLENFDEVSEMLEMAVNNEIQVSYIEKWPLFMQYRTTENYRQFKNKHIELFKI